MRRQRLPAFALLTAGIGAFLLALDKDSAEWAGFAISLIFVSLIVLRDVGTPPLITKRKHKTTRN